MIERVGLDLFSRWTRGWNPVFEGNFGDQERETGLWYSTRLNTPITIRTALDCVLTVSCPFCSFMLEIWEGIAHF